MVAEGNKQVAHRWYLGGIASAGAACGTHPLDLLKVSHHVLLINNTPSVDCQVHLQTQQVVRQGFGQMIVNVVRHDGFLALYNGLTASVLRQVKAYCIFLHLTAP